MTAKNGVVMLVDDDPYMLESASLLLEEYGLTVRGYSDARKALASFAASPADVILTDICMPGMDGMALLEAIRAVDEETPVLLMTSYADLQTAVTAVKKGAFDFIIKPYQPLYLFHAVERGIKFKGLRQIEKNYRRELEDTVALRTSELASALTMVKSMSSEIVERLSSAAEFRDEETGRHNARIGMYARRLAQALGMDEAFTEMISVAAKMHDIGKIGIPDSILLKPGRLTVEEFEVIKSHTHIGEKILRGSSHHMLQLAASIALNHHECWDGTGYPNGLRGNDIPMEGRIVKLVDQYDALRSRRVYKEPVDHEKAMSVIREGDRQTRASHFDPVMLEAFLDTSPDFQDVFDEAHG
ncbi:MAG TPA: HD domain-containing phosphohydrolase [Verrucomicrobiae bacterium]|nr:HD domain-containing phosphohydrolase [Verrucomicrobiae bacterium]